MKMMAQSKAIKLPKVRMSIEKMQKKAGDNCSVSILGYSDYPLMIWCYCSVCKQYYSHDKRILMQFKSCPVCKHKKVIVGYNDLATVRPDLVQFLKYQSDSTKYLQFSNLPIECQCPICGYERIMPVNRLSTQGFNCPYCNDINCNIVLPGKNDIATKAPWLIPYLKNPDDAYKYTWKSAKKIVFECPMCHKEQEKIIHIATVHGFHCEDCSDGISYPNKFVRSLLKQLPIEKLEYEYRREWTNRRFYDNYFVYNGKEYFVEADGGYHYDKYNPRCNTKEVKAIDRMKDYMAEEHNIIMIRIDCKKPIGSYIENSIKNSLLAEIFDLSHVNWEQCNKDAMKNIAYEVCLEFNKGEKLLGDIAEEFDISYSAAKTYIRQGRLAGFVSSESSTNRAYKIKKENAKNIGAVYTMNNELLFEFSDYIVAAEKLNQLDQNIKATKGSLWWCGVKSEKHIYKKKYKLKSISERTIIYE